MNKLNIPISTSCSRFIALLSLLIICIWSGKVDCFQYDDNDREIKNVIIPDNLYLLKSMNTNSDFSRIGSNYDLQFGQYHMIPFKKRTIPIELQKALYAHGIVGRRRRR